MYDLFAMILAFLMTFFGASPFVVAGNSVGMPSPKINGGTVGMPSPKINGGTVGMPSPKINGGAVEMPGAHSQITPNYRGESLKEA